MQHVVLAQRIAHGELLAGSGHGRQRHGGVALVGGSEDEILGDDVDILCCEEEVQLLVFPVEEGHVLVALMVLEAFDNGLRDGATLRRQRQGELLVLQHDVLSLSGEGRMEQGRRVLSCVGLGLLGLLLCGYLRHLSLFLGFLLFY